ncbi:MAG: hypothetical protein Q8R65_05465 [Polynucleobacter sp.]|jgi:hypothetical protein|nr:hypothetical protein [Polynucleobacter sp.]MDZ4056270.1 hypothetical protein [Polynucleobacter sp.]
MTQKPRMAQASDGVFAPGTQLRHKKTGGFYRVVCLANIEASLEPAYVYESLQTHDYWIRPKAEMEDGRFEPL